MKNLEKEELQEILKNCKSKADFCRALDLNPKGGNYKVIDKIIKDNNLITYFTNEPWNKGKKYKYTRYTLDEILIKDSPYHNTTSLRKRLIREGIKEAKCEICGYEHNIELHHINGNPFDNRLENLQILCPNCHSKTENYRIKNSENYKKRHSTNPETLFITEEEAKQRELEKKEKKKKKDTDKYKLDNKICPYCGKEFHPRNFSQIYCSSECSHKANGSKRPDVFTLLNDFKELKSFVQVGKKYGITDNAVRKWCRLYELPIHSKDMKEYLENINNPDYIIPENKVLEKKVLNHDKIMEDYKKISNMTEVAKLNNCDPSSVKNILVKNNIERRNNYSNITQYDLNGNELSTFKSAKDAAEWLIKNGYTKAKEKSVSHFIRDCCSGEKATAYKFKWQIKHDLV